MRPTTTLLVLLFVFSKGMEAEDDPDLITAIANSMITWEAEQSRCAAANVMTQVEEQRPQDDKDTPNAKTPLCECPMCINPIELDRSEDLWEEMHNILQSPEEAVDYEPQQHGEVDVRVTWLGGGPETDKCRRRRGEITVGVHRGASIRGDWETDEVWAKLAQTAPHIVATDCGSTKFFLKTTYQRLHRYAMSSETKHFVVELDPRTGRLISNTNPMDVEDVFPASEFGYEIIFSSVGKTPSVVATRGKLSDTFARLWIKATYCRRLAIPDSNIYIYDQRLLQRQRPAVVFKESVDDIVLDLKAQEIC